MTTVFRERVYQNPVRFNMAVTAARKVAAQRMVFVLRWQWLTINQKVVRRAKSLPRLPASLTSFLN
jgi:hypothetical protein